MFPALISFAAVLGAAVITSEDISYVRVQASDSTVEAGKPFSVDVFAYAHVPVNAVDITLNFDKDNVEVTGVDTGQSVITIWTEEPVISENTVTMRGGTYRKGFLNEHKIATINLLAKSTGSTLLKTSEIMLLAGDGAGTKVELAENPESYVNVFIYDENTDPQSIAASIELKIITDINGDGKVTLQDVSAFMSAWHTKNIIFDFNNDGKMTFKDFSIILADMFLK